MRWTVVVFPSFLKDLGRLTTPARERVEQFVEEVLANTTNPFALPNVEKLKVRHDYYRARIGAYRIGLRIDKNSRLIEVRRVLHRRDIYRHFP